VLYVAVLALLSHDGMGCSHPRQVADEHDARPPEQPSDQHWVQDARVRAVMDQIAAGTASWPQDLPPHPEAANPLELERAFADSARLADTLAAAATELPAAVAARPMPDEHRRGFVRQAQTLRRHALELHAAARLHNVSEMQRALARINTSCFECHGKYRDVAGELKK
jgi:hypothetical protein